MRDRIKELIDIFREDNGEPTSKEVVAPAAFEKYRGRLPDCLLGLWRENGWAGYGNGRWWTVNPADFEGLLDEWLEGTPFPKFDRFHCFARSGFGKLHAWGENLCRSITIDPASCYIAALPAEMGVKEKEPELAFATHLSFLTPDSGDMEGDNGEFLFDAAVKKFGPLASDEVFGFEPALVLGGAAAIDSIRKLRLDVHLSILRQFEAPQTPGF